MNSALEPPQRRPAQPSAHERTAGGAPLHASDAGVMQVPEKRLVEPACEVRDVATCPWFVQKRYELLGEDPGLSGNRRFRYRSQVTGQVFYSYRPLGAE